MMHFPQGSITERPKVHSNHILILHANTARGEARGGTYGVRGENRTSNKVGDPQLAVNEPDVVVRRGDE